MSEEIKKEEQEKLDAIDQQIEALKQKKLAAEEPKVDPPKAPEPPEVPKEEVKEEQELEEKLIAEIDKQIGIPKEEFQSSGIYIEWIDHRYHIKGIRGMSKNTLIVRDLTEIDTLILNLEYAKAQFNQKEMISTK